MLLARAGHDVVMVDRSRPVARHQLDPLAVPRRRRAARPLGAARRGGRHRRPRDPVRRRSTTTARTIRHAVKDRAGVDFLVAPRRYVLDDLLADAAVAAGARWSRARR